MKIKEIIKKWEDKADYFTYSDSDDPYFARDMIKDFIKDIKECEDIDNDEIEEEDEE